MNNSQLKDVIRELIAMFQEETQESWSDMYDLLISAGLDDDMAQDIIDELEES